MAIVFSSSKRHQFKNFIAEVVEFEEVVVVRLGDEPTLAPNENVFAFDYSGKLLWQIPKRPQRTGHSPYVSIIRNTMFLDAFNWDGSFMTVHPKKGFILHEDFSPSHGTSRRTASPRRWI